MKRGIGNERGIGGVGHEHSREGLGSNTYNDSTGGDRHLGQSGTGQMGTLDGQSGSHTGSRRPSMMDKLNPKVDANGDGKAGFMK